MQRDAIDPEIFAEVARVLDPDGSIRQLRDGTEALARLLPASVAAQGMASAAAEADALLETAARANQIFSRRGWGVVNFPVAVLEAAINTAESDVSRADEVLADAWTEGHVDHSIRKMKYAYALMEPHGVSDIRLGRWQSVREAKGLHFSGRYRAAVPLMLANIEGFVADTNEGRLFFTRIDAKKMRTEDPTRLAGMVCALSTLHTLYTEGVGSTTAESRLSRHGIMHGRVLGYGNRVASAQVFTLFDAVTDLLA